jgi:hypothetical protein
MGMSASQARFLGLTARKTNVEYEGQQINQQRTALSNQTASYYTNLLGMNVPQPPAVQDYTKTTYSFTDGSLNNQLTSMIAHADGSYTVSYARTYMDHDAIVSAVPSRIVRNDNYSFAAANANCSIISYTAQPNGTFSVNYVKSYMDNGSLVEENITDDAVYLENDADGKLVNIMLDDGSGTYVNYPLTVADGFAVGGVKLNAMGDATNRVANDPYYASLSNDAKAKLLEEEEAILKELQTNWSQNNTDNWLVKYTQNTSTGVYEPTYYNESVLAGATYDSTSTSVSYIGAYTRGSAQVTDEIKGVTAFLEQDSTGRYINVTMSDVNGNMTTYALTTATVTDDDAYNDAMNQYEYDKAQYDRDIQEINAKIEIIQSEDKDLELRLKQLDTEQAAITNELEAVNKVIEKNVESSFKTFG